MGGVDKGLQDLDGSTLVQHALARLAPQVGQLMVSANRNLPAYAALGVPVWPDDGTLGDYAGPLAGFVAGLAHCSTPWLLTVPCDTPNFPVDLAARLAVALEESGKDLAVAAAPGETGESLTQPVFCLMRASLHASLLHFTRAGGRKIGAWTAQQAAAVVPFNQPGDDRQAFFNANTLAELAQLRSAR